MAVERERGHLPMIDRLGIKRRLFVQAYIKCLDIYQAGEQAGIVGQSNIMATFRDNKVQQAIKELTARKDCKARRTAEEVFADIQEAISICKEKVDLANWYRFLKLEAELLGIKPENEKEVNINICVSSKLSEAKNRARKYIDVTPIETTDK